MNKDEKLIIDSVFDKDNTESKAKNFSFSKNSPIIIRSTPSPDVYSHENHYDYERQENLINQRKNFKTFNHKKININLHENFLQNQLPNSNEIKFNDHNMNIERLDNLKINDFIKSSFNSPKKLHYKEDSSNNSFKNRGNIIINYRNQRHIKTKKYDNPNLIEKTNQLIKEAILKDDKINDKEEKENNDKILHHIRDYRQYSISQDMLDEQTTFYFNQYFEMILLHMGFFILGPFLNLFILYKYGKNLSCNMNFWGDKLKKTLILQYFFWITSIMTITLSIIIWKNTYENSRSSFNNQYIFLSIGYLSQILIIIRYLTVCVKYGFFPKGYYELFKKEDLMEHSLKSNFLYNGWINPRFKIIDELINESLLENKIDLTIFNLQCVGKIDSKLIHDLKMIELEISEDQERLKNEYLMYLLKKVQLNKYKDILKNTKIADKMHKIRKITTDEIDIERGKIHIVNRNNCLNQNDHDTNNINLKEKYQMEDNYKSNEICTKLAKNETEFEKDTNVIKVNQENNLELSNLTNSNDDCNEIQVKNIPEINSLNYYNKKEIYKCDYTFVKKENLPHNKPYTTFLRNVVINKVFPIIYQNRKKKAEKINTLEGKVKKLNDFVFEINGMYLCRLMMKKAHDINFASYFCFHVIFFIFLLIIPNIFLGGMYLYYSTCKENIGFGHSLCYKKNISIPRNVTFNFQKENYHRFLEETNKTKIIEKLNKTKIGENHFVLADKITNNTTDSIPLTDNMINVNNITQNNSDSSNFMDIIDKEILTTNWNSVSFFIWSFSIISSIIPIWLITKNLIYGMIDFQRRRKLLEIIGEIVNINSTGKRDFYLINITHYETLINWYTLRNIFMNYGKRFTDRLIIQVTIFCVFVLISLIIIIFIFLGYIQRITFMVLNLYKFF